MVKAGAKVLDVGCACGTLACALALKKCELHGFEYNPASVKICQNSHIFTSISLYDLNTLTHNDFPHYFSEFDYIICADVLEHLIEPQRVLEELLCFLKPSGKIIISLPNVAHASIKTNLLLNDFSYTEMGILDKTHLHFYTYSSIADLLNLCKIKITKVSATYLPPDGWQPHKISELPKDIATFIIKDKHSHIMQYIIEGEKSNSTHNRNTQLLNSLEAKQPLPHTDFVFYLKRFIIQKTPWLIKYIEKLKI